MSAEKNVAKSSLALGIVGYGNMGRALALGVTARNAPENDVPVLVYEAYAPNAEAARKEGFAVAPDMAALAAASNTILLAVKPDQMAAALDALAPALKPGTLLISIAAGLSIEYLSSRCGAQCHYARVMPNTPALVGQGVFGLCFGAGVPEALRHAVRGLFASIGLLIEIKEEKMNAFTALSGSGPGYVFHFMESLAEAGVSVGLDRESSKAIALALLRGCAAMAEKGEHAAVLREQVSSPGGTTIAGLNHLDRSGARGMLVDAVRAACLRGGEMEKAGK